MNNIFEISNFFLCLSGIVRRTDSTPLDRLGRCEIVLNTKLEKELSNGHTTST